MCVVPWCACVRVLRARGCWARRGRCRRAACRRCLRALQLGRWVLRRPAHWTAVAQRRSCSVPTAAGMRGCLGVRVRVLCAPWSVLSPTRLCWLLRCRSLLLHALRCHPRRAACSSSCPSTSARWRCCWATRWTRARPRAASTQSCRRSSRWAAGAAALRACSASCSVYRSGACLVSAAAGGCVHC